MTEEQKQNTKRKMNGAMILMGSALSGILLLGGVGVYQMTKAVTDITTEVSALRTQVENVTSNQPTQEKFQQMVASSLESLAAQKQKQMIDAKFSQYQAAQESVPNDKSIYGDPNARFTLVEFSDLECPYCKRFHDTPKQIVDASSGNVNWQWKHLPLGFHNPAAEKQALAAECVREDLGNRAFWVFLDDIFKYSRGNGQGVPDLAEVISGVGADLQKVRDCMSEGRFNDKIQADVLMASKGGINGTPATYVVDNVTGKTQLVSGAQPAEAIMSVMRKMIAEHKEEQKDS